MLLLSTFLSAPDPLKLLRNLPSGAAQGIIWGIMALGVYITFKVLSVSDLTVEGSFATGGAVAVMMIVSGKPAWLAVLAAACAGVLCGLVTGLLHTLLGIPAILAGILTQLALYSVNLRIMNMSANQAVSVDKYSLILSSRNIPRAILIGGIIAASLIGIMYWYFGTEQGSAIRATGNNPAMSRAQGINIDRMKILGFAISNGIVAFSGGLLAQYQGFADINMGRGASVIGLAAVIIGEVIASAIFKRSLNFAVRLFFVIVGGIAYYAVVIVVLWLKLNTNDLKLFTAVIVALFLAVPYLREQRRTSFAARKGGKEDA